MRETTNNCPVCGAVNTQKDNSLHCASCETKLAFLEYFASKEVFEAWHQQMQAGWNAYRSQQLTNLRSHARLIIGPEFVAFHDAQAAKLTIVDRFGKVTSESAVRHFSAGNMHQVTVSTRGTVAAKGDNDAGQCKLTYHRYVNSALAAPHCTYLVSDSGAVSAVGQCNIREQIEQWTNIQSLACGTTHLVGLTKDGTVVQADSSAAADHQEIANWKNVTAIAAAANYTLALHADGTVSYAGPKQQTRNAISTWKNIIAIAADSQYAVGLTKDGHVLLAGECSPFLDGGRSQARSWENVVCISANHGVIAAMDQSGALLLAGRFLYSDHVADAFQQANPAKI